MTTLGDARSGKLADNIAAFGRALRRAGLRVDSARIALAQEAAGLVGIGEKEDLGAALEAVLVSREQERAVFRELFDAFFRDPDIAHKLLAQMLPSAKSGTPPRRRPRVSEALAPQQRFGGGASKPDQEVRFDAAMTASDLERLKHADFTRSAPASSTWSSGWRATSRCRCRRWSCGRMRPGVRGKQLHWARTLRQAAHTGARTDAAAPHAALARAAAAARAGRYLGVDGALRPAAARLPARRHARAPPARRVRVRHAPDGPDARLPHRRHDAMLAAASASIDDFAGGTRLGESLATLRRHHARRLVGRRTLVLLISDGLIPASRNCSRASSRG